jgi:hypothetical protein
LVEVVIARSSACEAAFAARRVCAKDELRCGIDLAAAKETGFPQSINAGEALDRRFGGEMGRPRGR